MDYLKARYIGVKGLDGTLDDEAGRFLLLVPALYVDEKYYSGVEIRGVQRVFIVIRRVSGDVDEMPLEWILEVVKLIISKIADGICVNVRRQRTTIR